MEIPDIEGYGGFETGHLTSADGTSFGLRIAEQIVAGYGLESQVTDSDDGGTEFQIAGIDIRE